MEKINMEFRKIYIFLNFTRYILRTLLSVSINNKIQILTFSNIQLFNIYINRYLYNKQSKRIRFFQYESYKYYLADRLYMIHIIKKIDTRLYLSNFINKDNKQSITNITTFETFNNDSTLMTSLLNQKYTVRFNKYIYFIQNQILKNISTKYSYKYLNKQFNKINNSSHLFKNNNINIFNKFKLKDSFFYTPIVQSFNKIIEYTIIFGSKKIPYNNNHRIQILKSILKNNSIFSAKYKLFIVYVLCNICMNTLYKLVKISILQSYNLLYFLYKKYNNSNILTSIYLKINNNKKCKAILTTKSINKLLKHTSSIQYINPIYEIVAYKRLYRYQTYFNIFDKSDINFNNILLKYLLPTYTYRLFYANCTNFFYKYYLHIYTGKYINIKLDKKDTYINNITTCVHNICGELYNTQDKFHYFFKKIEQSSLNNSDNLNNELYLFLLNNHNSFEYAQTMYNKFNSNNFYFPLIKQNQQLEKNNDNFKMAVTHLYTNVIKNKNIYQKYRNNLFNRTNNILFDINDIFQTEKKTLKEISMGILTKQTIAILNNPIIQTHTLFKNTFVNAFENNSINTYLEHTKSLITFIPNLLISNKLKQTQIQINIFNLRKKLKQKNYINTTNNILSMYTIYNQVFKKNNFDNQYIMQITTFFINFLIYNLSIPILIYSTIFSKEISFENDILICYTQKIVHLLYLFSNNVLNICIFNVYIFNIISIIKKIIQLLYMNTIKQTSNIIIEINNIIPSILNIINIFNIFIMVNKYTKIPYTTNLYSDTLLPIKIYSKIAKIKTINKKNIIVKNAIKYYKYNSITNTILIYNTNNNTTLNSLALSIFYIKSRILNNNYNEKTRLNILLFKKFIYKIHNNYHITRWLSFNDLIIDLVSNYKTIHKDSSIYDIKHTTIQTSWLDMTTYLSNGHYPYSRNILDTTINDNIVIQLVQYFLNDVLLYTRDSHFFWYIQRDFSKYLEITWLYEYLGDLIEEPFISKMYPTAEYWSSHIQQQTLDIVSKNLILWDMPIYSYKTLYTTRHIYVPSYFNNELYYLDYIDYIFFKYYILQISKFKLKYIDPYNKFNTFEIKNKKNRLDKFKIKYKKEVTSKTLNKSSWDINTYDLQFVIKLLDSNKINVLHRSNVLLSKYMTTNLLNNEIDTLPFQIAALRWIQNNSTTPRDNTIYSTMRKLKSKLKILGSNVRSIRSVRTHDYTHTVKKVINLKILNIFNTIKQAHNKSNSAYIVISKLKTLNRPGIYNLHIIPNYFKNSLYKEIYLYRKTIGLIMEENNICVTNTKIITVEKDRLIKTIINFNIISNSFNILMYYTNINTIEQYLNTIELYRKNIYYYNQIILSHHTFIKNTTNTLLHSAFNLGYEWNDPHDKLRLRTKKEIIKLTDKIKKDETYLMSNYNFFMMDENEMDDETSNKLVPSVYTQYTTPFKFKETNKKKIPTLIEIISESNRQLIDCVYTGTNTFNSDILDTTNIYEFNIQITLKIKKILLEFKKKIFFNIQQRISTMKRINKYLYKLKIPSNEYIKYSFNILFCSFETIQEFKLIQIPLSFMLLYVARLPFIHKFYKYIHNNLLINIDRISIPYVYNNKFNTMDMYIYKQTMQILQIKNKIQNVTLQENTVEQYLYNINTSLQPNTHDIIKKKAYTALYNSFFERRFIWYISKSIHNQYKYNQKTSTLYNNVYISLLIKNKLNNTNLTLFNLEKLTIYSTSMALFASELLSIPILYNAVYDKKIQHIYVQVEPIIPLEENETSLIITYYKQRPFFITNKQNSHSPMYIDFNYIYNWKKYEYYITYPINIQKIIPIIGIISNYFVRYKIYNIDLLLKEQSKSNTNIFMFQLASLYTKQFRPGKLKYLQKYVLMNLNKIVYDTIFLETHQAIKFELYFAAIRYHIGIIHYTTNLIHNSKQATYILPILNTVENDLKYIVCISNILINESGVFSINEESTTDREDELVDPLEPSEDHIHKHYIFKTYPDTADIIFIAYLYTLIFKKSILFKNKDKIQSNSNRMSFFIYSIMMEPIFTIIGICISDYLDTESSNILKYDSNRLPSYVDSTYDALLKLPLTTSYDERSDDLHGELTYLYTHYFKLSLDSIDILNNIPHAMTYGALFPAIAVRIETEPLHIFGIEVNISPFFRMFTYSGWKIWKEQLNQLLLLQQYKFWNINYSADVITFLQIFDNFINIWMSATTINQIKDSFKNYNFHEEYLSIYLQKYHRIDNINMFKTWLQMYFYGLTEYQRIIPDSYDKLFSQPSIRSFLYYNFINAKEFELVTKRALNRLSDKVYSLQQEPIKFEEFFVYPTKRVIPAKISSLGQYRRTLWLYNYSMPINTVHYPRTGYEAYPYAYAQNIWYFHHNFATSSKIYNEFYNVNYTWTEEIGNFLYYRRAIIEYYNIFHEYIYKTFLDYYKIRKPRKISQRSYWESTNYPPYKESEKYSLLIALKKFFITNTIKYTDINLLYKPYTPKINIGDTAIFTLHPAIRYKYSLNTKSNININVTTFVVPKQKTKNMFLLDTIYTSPTWAPSSNDLIKQLNKYTLFTDVRLNTFNTINAYKGYIKTVSNSNASFHEKAYGPFWSIYHKSIMDSTNATNLSSLGTVNFMALYGLIGIRNTIEGVLDPGINIDDLLTTLELLLIRSPNVVPADITQFPDAEFTFLNSNDDLAATQLSPVFDQNSWFHQLFIPKSKRSYKDIMMPTLHSMYIPYNTHNLRNYTSYIPVRYNLHTKDLLNNNYIKSHYWFNPSFQTTHIRQHIDTIKFNMEGLNLAKSPKQILHHTAIDKRHNLLDTSINAQYLAKTPIHKKKDVISNTYFTNKFQEYINIFTDYITAVPWTNKITQPNTVHLFDTLLSKRTTQFSLEFPETEEDVDLAGTYRKYIRFGYAKRQDMNYPFVRSYLPNKIYGQVSKYNNLASIYKNRYNFINIYEAYRLVPFMHLNKVYHNTMDVLKYIDPIIKTATGYYNKIIYPLESQWSINRNTAKLAVLDIKVNRSIRHKKYILYSDARDKLIRQIWTTRYLRFFAGPEMLIAVGIKPKKKYLYEIFNIFKLNLYNKFIQSMYYQPTKSFYPTTVINKLGRILQLNKPISTQRQKLIYGGEDLFLNENYYTKNNFHTNVLTKYTLKLKKEKHIGNYPPFRRREMFESNRVHEQFPLSFISKRLFKRRKYMNILLLDNFMYRQSKYNIHLENFFLFYKTHITHNKTGTQRMFSLGRALVREYTLGIFNPIQIYHKALKIKKGFTRRDYPKEYIINIELDFFQNEQRKFNRELLFNTTSRIFKSKVPSYNKSTKIFDKLHSATITIFNNINRYSTIRKPGKGKGRNIISSFVISALKPRKYSAATYDLNSLTHHLISRKSNILIDNTYNNAYERLGKGINKKLRTYQRIFQFFDRERSSGLLGISHTGLTKDVRKRFKGYKRIVFMDSYWQYMYSKYLNNQSNKFFNSELITFKANPRTILDPDIEETTNIVNVRGSLFDKQFIYNYKINYKQYSLPLIEYFYYTQYSVDKTNILNLYKFNIFIKDIPTLFEEHIIKVHPFIRKEKNKNLTPILKYTNVICIKNDTKNMYKLKNLFTENMELINSIDVINYNLAVSYKTTIIDSFLYLYSNSFTRPITHWFIQVYYNNIYYFDAFYSWCCDFISSIIIF